MKRVIITPEQLKAINEAATQLISAPASNVQSVAQTALAKHPGQEVTIDVTDNTPGSDGTLGFSNTTAGTNPNHIKNYDKITFGQNGNNVGNPVSESRYTKRQVELGRILEMRKNGKVFSKKQLNEMFMESDDIAEKIKNRPAFDVMTSFGCVFGRDAEQEMLDIFSAGKNPTDFIVSVYNNASPEDQELFRKKVRI